MVGMAASLLRRDARRRDAAVVGLAFGFFAFLASRALRLLLIAVACSACGCRAISAA
jgi:hypothetical protein